MAQSTDSNPAPHQLAAPAQHATLPENGIQEPSQANPADDATINQESEPKVSSTTRPTLDSTSPVIWRTTTGITAEDEEDMWLAMTFDDFYQGIPSDDKPPPSKDTEANNAESKPVTNKPDQSHENNDFRIDEFRGLFLTPLACGFRREVAIDGMTVSYMAPDKITWLASLTAMEQYLKNNLTLELPTHPQLLLGKPYPEL